MNPTQPSNDYNLTCLIEKINIMLLAEFTISPLKSSVLLCKLDIKCEFQAMILLKAEFDLSKKVPYCDALINKEEWSDSVEKWHNADTVEKVSLKK
jgi:hypothetical protein